MKKSFFLFALMMTFLVFSACDPDSGFEEITDISVQISPEQEPYALSDEISVSVSIPFHFKTYDSYRVDFTVEVYDSEKNLSVPTTALSFSDSSSNYANKSVSLTKTDYSGKESADFNFAVKADSLGKYQFFVDIIASPKSGYVYGVCHKKVSLNFTE